MAVYSKFKSKTKNLFNEYNGQFDFGSVQIQIIASNKKEFNKTFRAVKNLVRDIKL